MLPLRLRHLPLVEEQPSVGLHRARRRNPRGHQKRRPVDAVEPADLFADQVHIRRPELFKARLVRRIVRTIPESRNVVRQRVQPHIHHVLLIARHRNAPRETRPAHRQVLQPPAHKADHLAPRRLRPHESRIRLVKLQQLALEGRQLEEVVFFAHRLRHAPAIRARRPRRPIHIQLVAHAVLSGIEAFVDVPPLAQRGKQMLHPALVSLLGRPDKVVVGQSQPVPQPAKLARNRRRKLHRRPPRLRRGPLDLLPMLVRAGQKPCLDAQCPLPPRNGVAHDRRVSVAQVRPRIHVINRRGQVIAFCLGFGHVQGFSVRSPFLMQAETAITIHLTASKPHVLPDHKRSKLHPQPRTPSLPRLLAENAACPQSSVRRSPPTSLLKSPLKIKVFRGLPKCI